MPETTNFFILFIIRIIDFFCPSESHSNRTIHQAHQVTGPTENRFRRNRRQHGNRSTLRHHIDIDHNFDRARIIHRARRITANNRRIASQAEQALVEAIVQARRESSEEARLAVRFLRTRNERPARPIRGTTDVNVIHTPAV